MATEETVIQLGEGWTATSDPSCWILRETRVNVNKETGKEGKYDKSSYHPTLEAALRAYANEKTKGIDGTGIIEEIRSLHIGIRAALEEHVKREGQIPEHRALEKNIEDPRPRRRK